MYSTSSIINNAIHFHLQFLQWKTLHQSADYMYNSVTLYISSQWELVSDSNPVRYDELDMPECTLHYSRSRDCSLMPRDPIKTKQIKIYLVSGSRPPLLSDRDKTEETRRNRIRAKIYAGAGTICRHFIKDNEFFSKHKIMYITMTYRWSIGRDATPLPRIGVTPLLHLAAHTSSFRVNMETADGAANVCW